jgi:hypothetical protein
MTKKKNKMYLYIYQNRHIKNEVFKIQKNGYIVLENNISKYIWKLYFRYNKLTEIEKTVTYIKVETFLNKEFNMKFDVVVGNPPYQDPDNKIGDKQKKLYVSIFAKSFELLKPNGTMSFIVPQAILTPGNSNINYETLNTYKLLEVDYSVDKNYNVGQKIVKITLKKELTDDSHTTKIINTDGTESMKKMPFVCSKEDEITFSIMWRMIHKYNLNKTKLKLLPVNDSKGGFVEKKDIVEVGEVEVLTHYAESKNKRTVFTNKINTFEKRVIVPNNISVLKDESLYKVTTEPTTVGFNSSDVKNKDRQLNENEYDGMIHYMKSPLVQFFSVMYKNVYKPSNVLNAVFVLIQPDDLTKINTNQELYDEFGITQEEQTVIEKWYTEWTKTS